MSLALQILIPTVSIVLAIVASHMSLRREIAGIHRDIAGLRERMARLEGIMEALLQTAGAPGSAKVSAGRHR